MTRSPEPDADRIKAVIFDMDGVVTDTAEAHFDAWKTVFDAFLSKRDAEPSFSREDYLAHVDGVPRYDGVRRFLASRGIDLPDGEGNAEGHDTVRGLGNLKNRCFRTWLSENTAPVFEDATDMIDGLTRADIRIGVFSASRNAAQVLASAGLESTFQATVDGADADDLGLAPKPDPAQLIETAHRLGATPSETAVVEDAVSGVKAAADGGFGLVIGVNRQQNRAAEHRHALRGNGADLVTRDLRQLLLPDAGLKTLDSLPPVWDSLDAVNDRRNGRALAVFLDFDGTLSPIVEDYREAKITDATRDAIRRLAARWPVAVVSGRDLDDVRNRVGIDGVIYAGSHGFDIAGPDGLKKRPDMAETFLAPIAEAADQLRAAAQGIAGAKVERKAFSIAVHFREVADDDIEALESAVNDVTSRHDDLRKGRGKKVFEIQPRAEWDKGRAVEWLLAHTPLGSGGPLPLYVGDDLTDEDAFATLGDDGLGVAVRSGKRATLADYALSDPDDVRRFIDWLTEQAEATE